MIELRNVDYAYRKGHNILENLSLTVDSGSVCGLLGRNGVGKSTMLYLMAGLLRPQSGTVACGGFVPFERKTSFLNDIFIVPEEFALPAISMREYVEVNAPFYPKFDMELFASLLNIFELEGHLNLGALSMGMKKKAFLSFAMACNTSILLLDEPTNGLDISAKMAFRKAVSQIMSDDKSVLISTHQVHDVEQILDHVIIADNREIILNTSIAEICSRLRFGYSSDPQRNAQALFGIQAPGGMVIAERVKDPMDETEVNLECLFEMADKNRNLIKEIFN